jgi:MFS superfamily sulfate permease-like transporter
MGHGTTVVGTTRDGGVMAAGTGRERRGRRKRPAGVGETRTGAALGLFAEVVLAGVLVALGSLLLVTAVPSLAAGVAHVRRQVTGHDIGVARFARDWWAAVRALWPLGLAAVAVALLLALDWQLARADVLPGASVVAVVVAVAAAAVVVVLARAAGAWSESADGAGLTARQALAAGAQRTQDDLTGSVLLAVAAALCVVFVWMLPPLVLVVGGLLSLAVVGVEIRRSGRAAA